MSIQVVFLFFSIIFLSNDIFFVLFPVTNIICRVICRSYRIYNECTMRDIPLSPDPTCQSHFLCVASPIKHKTHTHTIRERQGQKGINRRPPFVYLFVSQQDPPPPPVAPLVTSSRPNDFLTTPVDPTAPGNGKAACPMERHCFITQIFAGGETGITTHQLTHQKLSKGTDS